MGEWVRVVDDPLAAPRDRGAPGHAARRAGWAPARRVNSDHHQAVDRLGDGLRTAALAADGTVEATESINGAYDVGPSGTSSSTCARTSATRGRCRRWSTAARS